MATSAPYEARFNHRTGLWCVRDDRGPVLGYEDIETQGDAEGHVVVLTEADRVRALEDAAALDDFEAQQIAEAA